MKLEVVTKFWGAELGGKKRPRILRKSATFDFEAYILKQFTFCSAYTIISLIRSYNSMSSSMNLNENRRTKREGVAGITLHVLLVN